MNQDFEFITNQKGKASLICNGYQFTLKTNNENRSSLWRCVNRKVCTASITLDQTKETILRESPHTCEPSPVVLAVNKTMSTLKRKVCNNLGPIQKMYEETVQKLRKKYPQDLDLIPSFNSKKDALYRARKKWLNTDLLSHNSTECIQIPEVLAKNFLVCEDGETDKIFIFSTKTARMIIKNPGAYFADGTFKSSPKPFYQLYTIHFDLGSNEESTNVVPVIYALLPNKNEQTYVRLFS